MPPSAKRRCRRRRSTARRRCRREAATRGQTPGLSDVEVRFYDVLAANESAVRELSDATQKKIAHELTENLRRNVSVDWSQRDSVRAKLRLMVKRILRK